MKLTVDVLGPNQRLQSAEIRQLKSTDAGIMRRLERDWIAVASVLSILSSAGSKVREHRDRTYSSGCAPTSLSRFKHDYPRLSVLPRVASKQMMGHAGASHTATNDNNIGSLW